jgi:hypothetical protein
MADQTYSCTQISSDLETIFHSLAFHSKNTTMKSAIFAPVFLVSLAITVVAVPVPDSSTDGQTTAIVATTALAATILSTAVAIGGALLTMLIQMHVNINVGRKTVDHVFERLQKWETEKKAFGRSMKKRGE